jgi:16S rRNA G966 N2-methylase RsmD
VSLKVESLAVDSLVLDPQNARKHSDANLAAIAKSLSEFGQRKPIVVTADNVVVAGNGTVEAARFVGLTSVDVVRVPKDWSADQVKAFALADNRSAELAEWHPEVLSAQLLELGQAGFDIEALGFESVAVVEPIDDDKEIESFAAAPQRASLGDHWRVGEHEVICGDAMQEGLLTRFNATFDAVITDPPYGIGAGSWKRLGKGKKNNNESTWDESKPPVAWLLEIAPQVLIWGGNYFADELPPTNDWLCWHKKNDGRTFSEFELAWTNFGKQARLLQHHWSGEGKLHMTMKPSPVMDWCVSFVPRGSKIVDVFAGSGSTLLAAHRNGQIGYGVELDPVYVDVILNRLEILTGEKAVLDASG